MSLRRQATLIRQNAARVGDTEMLLRAMFNITTELAQPAININVSWEYHLIIHGIGLMVVNGPYLLSLAGRSLRLMSLKCLYGYHYYGTLTLIILAWSSYHGHITLLLAWSMLSSHTAIINTHTIIKNTLITMVWFTIVIHYTVITHWY